MSFALFRRTASEVQRLYEAVGPELAEMLTLSDLARLEIHGPAAELEKLKGPLADLKPEWFVYECGVER